MKKYFQKLLIISGLLLTFFWSNPAWAAQTDDSTTPERKYWFERIETVYQINSDTSFNVEEKLTYYFQGTYHKGWRSIPQEKFDELKDVQVFDGETGKELEESNKSLDKEQPSSWGKYYHEYDDGNYNIEWYYDQTDKAHTWIIKYKILGGIEFNKNNNRLYWNVFSDYEVPVKDVKTIVKLPEGVGADKVNYYAYRNRELEIKKENRLGEVEYSTKEIDPYEPFTVDTSWPKGFIDENKYWQYWAISYAGYYAGPFCLIIFFILGYIYWLKNEKLKKGRGTIIPQYEPPKNLPPAMAEIICKEMLTDKALTATIIDLAVRGYVKIEEEAPTATLKLQRLILKIVVGVCFAFIAIMLSVPLSIGLNQVWHNYVTTGLFLAGIFLVDLFVIVMIIRAIDKGTDYRISVVKDYSGAVENDLHRYEKRYLQILLSQKGYFSTGEQRLAGTTEKRHFYLKMQELKKEIPYETEKDTRAYEIGFKMQEKKVGIWLSIFIVSWFLCYFVYWIGSWGVFTICLVAGIVGLWSFVKYDARLNYEGRVLKEEWLGFKMYLETAEKYRMQNLTPELFERFLPYAIIFGLEKKWAQNFESMHLSQPTWYSGSTIHGSSVSSASSSGFSPSTFSASFSSSFSAAFASSGGSGSSGGGGGSAGGGGGGGGGGAS